MFVVNILTGYIIPIIYESMISLILVLAFLFIFRIKDSNIRILFFFLPLIKPFLIIAERLELNPETPPRAMFNFGMRLPDPNKIINPAAITAPFHEVISTDINYLYLLITISAIFLILLVRWAILANFYRHLAYEEKVYPADIPDIYRIIDDYTSKIKTRVPDVSLTHKNIWSPFIVGIIRCTLVLSPRLIERLDTGEKETVIHHELAHIKRNDNLIGWIALILRDLLFFNPFAYIAFYLIKTEQEKDCDKLMLKYSGKKPKEIAKNMLNALLKIKKDLLETRQNPIAGKPASTFTGHTLLYFFNFKRLKNRVNVILKTDPAKIYSRIFPRIIMIIFFIVLLILQIVLVVKIGDHLIFMR